MAVVVGDNTKLIVLLNLFFLCFCFAELKQTNGNHRIVDVDYNAGQKDVDWSKATGAVIVERKYNTHFLQALLQDSRSAAAQVVLYKDDMALYEARSKSIFLLPNATLLVCFSVVFGYIFYIILALMFKPKTVENDTNPALKVLFNEISFRDSVIPAKLRGLYEESEPGCTEAILNSPEKALSSVEEPSDKKNKISPHHLFNSSV